MQETSPLIPFLTLDTLRALGFVGIGGLIVRLITLWQNRRRPYVEVGKTEAETTEIKIRTHSAAGESMIRMMDRLDVADVNIQRLRAERDKLQEEVDLMEIQRTIDEKQIKHMKGLLDALEIPYDKFRP